VEDVKKGIDLAYVLTALVAVWFGTRFVDSIWGIFETAPNPDVFFGWTLSTIIGGLLGIGITAYLRLKPNIYKAANETGVELKKTIWPGWEETRSNTIVVIVVTFILGFILWAYDILWRTITGIIYT